MENEIKSKANYNQQLNKEPINTFNENYKDSENNKNINKDDIKVNNLEKAKKLLEKLLKESLDSRITLCEKNAKSQRTKMKVGLDLSQSLSKILENFKKQINIKIKKDKEKNSKLKYNKLGRNKKGLSPRKSAMVKPRTNFFRAKTPSHYSNKLDNTIHNKTPLIGLKRGLIKSRSNKNLTKNSKTLDANGMSYRVSQKKKNDADSKKKNNIFNRRKINNNHNYDDLQATSVTSIKTNKTNNTTTLNTISNSRTNNRLIKKKRKTTELTLKQNLNQTNFSKIITQKKKNNFNISEKNIINLNDKKSNTANNSILNLDDLTKRKKTPFKKKSKNNDTENVKIINTIKKKEKTIEDEIDDILSMEANLQKDTGIDNDPLLILPLKDLDFIPKGLLRRNSVSIKNPNRGKKYFITSFDISENINKIKFNNILKYLSLNDLLPINNLSKKFHQQIITYLIQYLENKQNEIIEIKNSLDIKKSPNRKGIENIVLSKGSKGAIKLLNESQLNELFKNEKIPDDELILIYRIYFQMINHSYSLIAKTDIEKFWEKCQFYFRNEQSGKTGDILISMIKKKKIEINGNNLYQIYNLIKGNLDKILPSYFSSKCGTTGLFAFVIKDILEFLGLSLKIKDKDKENAYYTYSDIIDAIKEKINYLKMNNI